MKIVVTVGALLLVLGTPGTARADQQGPFELLVRAQGPARADVVDVPGHPGSAFEVRVRIDFACPEGQSVAVRVRLVQRADPGSPTTVTADFEGQSVATCAGHPQHVVVATGIGRHAPLAPMVVGQAQLSAFLSPLTAAGSPFPGDWAVPVAFGPRSTVAEPVRVVAAD